MLLVLLFLYFLFFCCASLSVTIALKTYSNIAAPLASALKKETVDIYKKCNKKSTAYIELTRECKVNIFIINLLQHIQVGWHLQTLGSTVLLIFLSGC